MKHPVMICALLLLAACAAKSPAPQRAGTGQSDSVAAGFPYPEIPSALTVPEERKAYLLDHYWDDFDFADTALVNDRDVTEQGFANYIALLGDGVTPDSLVEKSMRKWCAMFLPHEHACEVMTAHADGYLYDPNSPLYSESLYGHYLQAMLASLPGGDPAGESLRFRLRLIRRNRVGERATDFSYQRQDGTRATLRQTQFAGRQLLLVFYDPDCECCHEVLGEMMADSVLREAIEEGRVTVLAIYTEGDEEAWRKSWSLLPATWILGNDHEAVKRQALYDLKAMPSLYLLDKYHKVLLKDAPYEVIRQRIGF